MTDKLLCCLMLSFSYSWLLQSCLNWCFNLDDKLSKMWWWDFQIAVSPSHSAFLINSASQIIFKDLCDEQTDYIEILFSQHWIIDRSIESVFSSIQLNLKIWWSFSACLLSDAENSTSTILNSLCKEWTAILVENQQCRDKKCEY